MNADVSFLQISILKPTTHLHTHCLLNQPIETAGGQYRFLKEACFRINGREILYLIGHGIVDRSCCGMVGCAYALVKGHVLKWKFRRNAGGNWLSEVVPIINPVDQKNIRNRIQTTETVSQVVFF